MDFPTINLLLVQFVTLQSGSATKMLKQNPTFIIVQNVVSHFLDQENETFACALFFLAMRLKISSAENSIVGSCYVYFDTVLA